MFIRPVCSLFLVFLSVSFSSFLHSQSLTRPNNHVRTVKVFSLKLSKDIDKRTNLEREQRFDLQGRLCEEIYFDSTGLERFKITDVYGSGRLLKRVYCTYRDTIAQTEYTLNEKGWPAAEITRDPDGNELCRFTFHCNPSGKIEESEAVYSPGCWTLIKLCYKYDLQGFYILRFLGDKKSNPSTQFTYEYDKTGMLVKISEQGPNAVPEGSITYDYSKKGDIKEFSVKHSNGKRYKWYLKYDDHGDIKEDSRNFYMNSALLDQERNEYKLDSSGNVKKSLKYRKNNELFMLYTYTYEFYE